MSAILTEERFKKDRWNTYYHKAQCDCGNEFNVKAWVWNKKKEILTCKSCNHKNKIKHELIEGEKFGEWEVVSIESQLANPRRVEVRCKCGFQCFRNLMELIKGRTEMCKECSKKSKFENTYKGVGELSGAYITGIKSRLIRRSKTLTFEVTKEYLWELYQKQDGKCSLSGVDLSFKGKTASLDRIDSTKGYIAGNVQWVHKVINKMKMELDQAEFINWCKIIGNYDRI